MHRYLRALIIALACAAILNAQSTNASVTGRITDPAKAVISGAAVTITNTGTNTRFRATTNGTGDYDFTDLPPGSYRIEVEKTGFKSLVKPDVVLHVQDAVEINFEMSIGSASESITVEGGAPVVESQSAAVSAVIDRQFAENLPMNGRSFQSLIDLTPGTVLTKSASQNLGQFSVNGQRNDANYFTVDGASANVGITGFGGLAQTGTGSIPATNALGGLNNLVSIDALQEFRVQTSSFAPEFGRSPGAQVQVITRSGTNEFHGAASDYLRNTVLDANDWFADSRALARAALQQNDYSLVLGGPVWIPRVYNGHNRTFFFFSYEGLKLLQPQTALTAVPNQATRQNAPAVLQPFVNSLPLPNGPDLGNGLAQFNASYSNPTDFYAVSIRIDQNLSNHVALFGRYNQSPSQNNNRGGGGGSLSAIQSARFNTYTATGGLTAIISPALTDELRLNYTKTRGTDWLHMDNFGGATPATASQLVPSQAGGITPAYIGESIANGTQTTAALGTQSNNYQRQVNVVDSFSYTVRGHAFRFGVDYRRLWPELNPPAYQLSVSFPNVPSMLAGQTTLVLVLANLSGLTLLNTNFSAFAQDTWKLSSRFTLTYGVRWDVNPAPTMAGSSQLAAVTNYGIASTMGLAPQGTKLWPTRWGNLAPRVGGAYHLFQHKGVELVLRGGFGVFYDPGTEQGGNAVGSGQFPFGARNTLSAITVPLTAAQLTPPPISSTVPTGTFYAYDPTLKSPRVLQWNVSTDVALGSSQHLSLSYIGASGSDLLRTQQVVPAAGAYVNFPKVTAFEFINNLASSNYQALQIQFERRLSRRLQARAGYVWSHSIDNASSDSPTAYYIPGANANIDRASSDFDVRHSVSGALTYAIPTVPGGGTVLRALLRGWYLDALLVAHTPTPVNIFVGADLLATGSTSVARPNLVAGVPLYLADPNAPGGQRYNRAAFSTPANGAQGTLGRNAMEGFNVFQLDSAVRREIRIRERVSIQLRGEAFNLFNHPNFGDPINTLTNASFGLSNSMYGSGLAAGGLSGGFSPLYQIGGPRLGQVALKLLF